MRRNYFIYRFFVNISFSKYGLLYIIVVEYDLKYIYCKIIYVYAYKFRFEHRKTLIYNNNYMSTVAYLSNIRPSPSGGISKTYAPCRRLVVKVKHIFISTSLCSIQNSCPRSRPC